MPDRDHTPPLMLDPVTGCWVPAHPLPPQGRLARAEAWAYDHGLHRVGALLGRLDERRLGR